MKMTKQLIVLVMAGLFFFTGIALAEGPTGTGGGSEEPPDLGDLILLYRDDNGVPYLTEDGCWQPLPFAGCPTECSLVPGEPAPPVGEADIWVLPVDPDTCAIVPECAICTQEVDFGRINEARSPDEVFESVLADVIFNLATADCLSLDPAGRMVTSRVADDLTVTSGAIDSPLQNLAIYKQLVLEGSLGAPLPDSADIYNTAARALGAASDKTGEVNVDLVAYLNQIMGLAEEGVTTIFGAPTCINMKGEVMGEVQTVRKCFLDYSTYGYERDTNFWALPDPAYIPEDEPLLGTFEYLEELTTVPTFGIGVDKITTIVFDDQPGKETTNIASFAEAADDSRAVIDFMHSWPLPTIYQTPVPCGADPGGLTSYDVSISDISGLQVPKRIVDGSEGREFTITVANAGPNLASGTVIVTAVAATGDEVEGSPWTFAFDDLGAGASESWTTLFAVDLGAITTINWMATVQAEFDVNQDNNSVTESTSVRLTSGGGGH